jgi:anthranilate/para-aminobenzoate synthase component I
MWSRRSVSIAPQPLEVARRLSDRPGVALLWSAWGSGRSYVMCDPVARVSALDPEPGLALDPNASEFGHVPRWLGVLPYESRRSLERRRYAPKPDWRAPPWLSRPVWWRYSAVVEVSDRVEVLGEDSASAAQLAALLARPPVRSRVACELMPPEAPELHVQRIERALDYIRRGELYQVNLARRQALRVEGHPIDLLALQSRTAAAPYAAALRTPELDLVSTSPELFLRLTPARMLATSPIKGTRPRGRNSAEDLALMQALDSSPKERAELTMVLDVERNDLGRVSEPGSVVVREPPKVQTYGSVHHRAATLWARLRDDVSRESLIETMLPSGSVTGAPKVRAMEVIAELEAHRRGLYTGAFGFVSHAGGLELAMAIRTLCIRGGEGEYFAGGGIVADSDPLLEVEETHWKAAQLAALLGADAERAGEGTEKWASRSRQR